MSPVFYSSCTTANLQNITIFIYPLTSCHISLKINCYLYCRGMSMKRVHSCCHLRCSSFGISSRSLTRVSSEKKPTACSTRHQETAKNRKLLCHTLRWQFTAHPVYLTFFLVSSAFSFCTGMKRAHFWNQSVHTRLEVLIYRWLLSDQRNAFIVFRTVGGCSPFLMCPHYRCGRS